MSSGPGSAPTAARLAKRYSLVCDLSIMYEGHTEALPIRIPDISTHGMFINTPRRFPEGAVLKIHFRLPRSGYEVRARGEVRYVLPDVGIGVEFLDLSPDAHQAIENEMAVPGDEQLGVDVALD